jgi:CBS domain containing-hemolysin-like protein
MRAFDVPIRRLAGLEDETDQPGDEAKNEILLAASNGAAEGAVERSEVEMIESVMEFRTTDAAEIMTPRTDMFALAEDTPLDRAAQAIHDAGFSRAPIYQDSLDNITGMLYAKDLLAHANTESGQTSLAEIARPCFFVPETITLDDLLREFKARKVHLAVVLDEYGGTAGLVSIEDVLEEIVGDISDEYDQARDEQVRRINETTLEVDGRLRIDELNDLLDIELPEDEDYDTVAGYAAAVLGYIPSAEETFDAPQVSFTVLEADPRRIVKLRVERLADESDDE